MPILPTQFRGPWRMIIIFEVTASVSTLLKIAIGREHLLLLPRDTCLITRSALHNNPRHFTIILRRLQRAEKVWILKIITAHHAKCICILQND